MAIPDRPLGMYDVRDELSHKDEISARDGDVLDLVPVDVTESLAVLDLEGKSAGLGGVTRSTTGPMVNLNVHNFFDKPTVPGVYVLEILHEISSSGAGTPALHSGTWPAGSTLTIINKQYIRGAGGNGGIGNGAAGGTAIYTTLPTTIDNTDGYVWAGGGGGGGAGGTSYLGGGGGAGKVAGKGAGNGQYRGGDGTLTTGGRGGMWSTVRIGGDGGGPGTAGGDNNDSTTKGGRGGYAIQRNGHPITWLGGNNSTRVKGTIV